LVAFAFPVFSDAAFAFPVFSDAVSCFFFCFVFFYEQCFSLSQSLNLSISQSLNLNLAPTHTQKNLTIRSVSTPAARGGRQPRRTPRPDIHTSVEQKLQAQAEQADALAQEIDNEENKYAEERGFNVGDVISEFPVPEGAPPPQVLSVLWFDLN
jgi:hypothetical protein